MVDLVPLFATVDDRDLALIQNDSFTTPEAVSAARDAGDNSAADINIIWMPEDTPRLVKDDGTVVKDVIAPGTIDTRRDPPKLVIRIADASPDQQELEDPNVAPHDVVVAISSNMPSDEIGRQLLEAASRLPNHGRYVHEYKRLEPIIGDVRLVKLWPGAGDTTIRCETIHASFDGTLSYEALSYTWGEKSPGGLIDMNGRPFLTRRNLADALRHLRLKDKPRTLWIDALCIDQINVEERNTQVGRMRDIYKGASRVLVFLGQAADDSDMAMDLITGDLDVGCEEAEMPQAFELGFEQSGQKDTSQENASNRDRDAPDTESTSDGGGILPGGDIPNSLTGTHCDDSLTMDLVLEEGEAEVPEEFKYYEEDDEEDEEDEEATGSIRGSSNHRAWAALDRLVRRPWWSRVWVLQEVVVPESDPLLICGNRTALWSEFGRFISTHCAPSGYIQSFITDKKPYRQAVKVSASHRTAHFFMIREHAQKVSPTRSIFRLLMATLGLDATDPRDKIFALVGLAPEKDRSALSPDYSKSTALVYAETTKHVITSTGNLDILSFNTNSQNTESPLPSWVSDWRLRASRAYPLYASDIYRASGDLPACVFPSSIGPSSDPSSITLGGILIDQVSDVSEVIILAASPSGALSELRQLIRKLEDMLLQIICRRKIQFQFPFNNAGDLAAWQQTFALDPDPRNSDQFWRTLLANRTMRYEAPAPTVYAQMFEMLFYQCDNTPARRVLDEGLRRRTGLDFPRLQTAQPSRVPLDYRPELPEAQRMAQYTSPLVMELMRLSSRVLFVTKEGRMGIAPKGVRSGDKIVILTGGKMPFIVRDRESNGASLQFISESYVHGVMNGEIIAGIPKGDKIEKHMLFFPFR